MGGRVVSLGSAEGAGRGHVNGEERRIQEDSFWKIVREDSFWKNIPQTVTVVLNSTESFSAP